LSEISHISLTRDPQFPEVTFATFIEFQNEVKREAYRLDFLPCSVPIYDFADRVAFYVELAALLNVPLHDESGWNGPDSRNLERQLIIIQPGETHPVLSQLQEPKKWNKW
jgi:hypothetical protein